MSETNPYAPPAGDLSTHHDFQPPEFLHLATGQQRVANYLLDYLGVFAFSVVVGIIAELVQPGSAALLDNLLVGIALFICYFLPSELFFARTPAKILTGTKVVSETGAPPSFGQILGRTFSRLVPFEPFSFVFGQSHSQRPTGWHDRWPKTRVVRTRGEGKFPPEPTDLPEEVR